MKPYVIALLVISALLGIETTQLSGQTDQFDEAFIQEDARFALIVNVERLMKYGGKESKLRKNFHEQILKLGTVDLKKLSQITIQNSGDVDMGKAESDGFNLSVVYHFKEKLGAEEKSEMIQKFNNGAIAEDHQGKEIFGGRRGPTLYFQDDQKMVFGADNFVKSIIAKPSKIGPMTTQIRDLSTDLDLAFVAINTPSAKKFLNNLGIFEGWSLEKISDQYETGNITINFNQSTPLRSTFTAKDESSAKQLASDMTSASEKAQSLLTLVRKQFEKIPERDGIIGFIAPPEILFPTLRKGIDELNRVLEPLEVTTEGKNVMASTKVDLKEFPAFFAKSLLAMMSRDIESGLEILNDENLK